MTTDRKTWSLGGLGRSSTRLAQLRAQSSSVLGAVRHSTACSTQIFIGSTLREEKHRRLLGKGQLHLHTGVLPLFSQTAGRTRLSPRQACLTNTACQLAFFFCLLSKALWSLNHPWSEQPPRDISDKVSCCLQCSVPRLAG